MRGIGYGFAFHATQTLMLAKVFSLGNFLSGFTHWVNSPHRLDGAQRAGAGPPSLHIAKHCGASIRAPPVAPNPHRAPPSNATRINTIGPPLSTPGNPIAAEASSDRYLVTLKTAKIPPLGSRRSDGGLRLPRPFHNSLCGKTPSWDPANKASAPAPVRSVASLASRLSFQQRQPEQVERRMHGK